VQDISLHCLVAVSVSVVLQMPHVLSNGFFHCHLSSTLSRPIFMYDCVLSILHRKNKLN